MGILLSYAEFINSLLSIYGKNTKQYKSITISSWVNSVRDCTIIRVQNIRTYFPLGTRVSISKCAEPAEVSRVVWGKDGGDLWTN